MIPHLVFSQVTLIALVCLFLRLQYAWLSRRTPCQSPPTLPSPHKCPREPKVFAGLTHHPYCTACEPVASSSGHLPALLSACRLCLSAGGWDWGKPARQRPSQWRSYCACLGVPSRGAGHPCHRGGLRGGSERCALHKEKALTGGVRPPMMSRGHVHTRVHRSDSQAPLLAPHCGHGAWEIPGTPSLCREHRDAMASPPPCPAAALPLVTASPLWWSTQPARGQHTWRGDTLPW
jgi:hypothetical protein